MNIIFRNEGYVVEIHCILTEDDTSLGLMQAGDMLIPYRKAKFNENNVVIEIPFKDLTIYDHASYKEIQGKREHQKWAEENDN